MLTSTCADAFMRCCFSFVVCLQRFRFTTSVLYTVCVSCEFLTPRFPSHFLLLTAVSNVGRAVGLTTFVSTQPAFQQALCASGNMADLASKTQVCESVAVVLCVVTQLIELSLSGCCLSVHTSEEAAALLLPVGCVSCGNIKVLVYLAVTCMRTSPQPGGLLVHSNTHTQHTDMHIHTHRPSTWSWTR